MDESGREGRKPRALVVGAGVAGLAAASSLHAAGWTVRVCERAPARRTGGYFVRLAADGVAAAHRLGAATGLSTRLPADGVIVGVDGRGRTVSRVEASLGEEPGGLALVRGDLERALWEALPGEVVVRFGVGPRRITEGPDAVEVELDAPGDPGPESYELVVGADGVRSTVRGMVFGPEERYRREFDHVVVSAVLPRLPGGLSEGDYVVLVEPGRTAHLMAVTGHRPVVFFTYRADRALAADVTDPVGALRRVYGDFGGLMPEILDGVAEAGATHADTVGQIHLEQWSRGRVVLVGDAAWCPTLYSGQGSALALTGGERLGAALAEHPGDVLAGLAAWERTRRPSARAAAGQARRSRHFFLPGNRLAAGLRAAALRLASWRPAGQVLQAVGTLLATGGVRPAAHGDTRETADAGERLHGVHPTATRAPGSWGPAVLDRP